MIGSFTVLSTKMTCVNCMIIIGASFIGQPALFQHICAVCWKKSKVRACQPASSLDCPLYEHWLSQTGDENSARVYGGLTTSSGEVLKESGMNELLELHEQVKRSGCPNYQGVKVPVRSKWNIHYMEQALVNYEDSMVVTFCKFGWPIGVVGKEMREETLVKNHRGATECSDRIYENIGRELREGTLLGSFQENPFSSPIMVSPLNTTEKRDSPDCRVMMDLSFLPGNSVNDRIPKNSYLGKKAVCTTLR